VGNHVKHYFAGENAGFIVCDVCGGRYEINKAMPAPVSIVIAIMKAFEEDHKHCGEEDGQT